MLSAEALKARLLAALPGADVELRDTTGTGDHFEARVVAAAFEGKSLVEQHQLVFAPFKEELASGALHALALKTYTPAQWAKQKR